MISEQQQEQASGFVLGALSAPERAVFEVELRANRELRDLVHDLQHAARLLALAVTPVSPPRELREKVLRSIGAPAMVPPLQKPPPAAIPPLRFLNADDQKGWKQLPVSGAWIKLLSLQPDRGYAVLLGKLEPGVHYPAHINAGPEDLYILTGDLHVGERRLGPGDFHHADAGSHHGVNYSLEGCTLLAVLTTDNPLVAFAMS